MCKNIKAAARPGRRTNGITSRRVSAGMALWRHDDPAIADPGHLTPSCAHPCTAAPSHASTVLGESDASFDGLAIMGSCRSHLAKTAAEEASGESAGARLGELSS